MESGLKTCPSSLPSFLPFMEVLDQSFLCLTPDIVIRPVLCFIISTADMLPFYCLIINHVPANMPVQAHRRQPTPIPQRTQVGVPTLPHGSFAPLGPYSCFLWESPAWACFPGDWPTAGVETGTVTNSGRLLCFWIVTTENPIVKSVNPETVEWRRSAHSHLHRYIQAGRPSSQCHRNPQSAQAMTFDL